MPRSAKMGVRDTSARGREAGLTFGMWETRRNVLERSRMFISSGVLQGFNMGSRYLMLSQ